MWILRAKQERITVFLTVEPEDSLKMLKQQLYNALHDTQLNKIKITTENDISENLQLKVHGMILYDEEKNLQEIGLKDEDIIEFSQYCNGEWESFNIEKIPE
ncbi:hypothetical protein PCANB_000273 [Pneumocystis canis]|nr:hypothetical protein PCK1_000354 [Pneumocystis canis]KAG5437927.1 hypothetical protein PCANB_000273 [Pneumocystis canis]